MKHLILFENFESDEEFGDRKTKSGSFINPEGDEYFEDEDEYDDDYDYIEYDNSEILESLITEKNVAKNSKLWNACKAWAKSKYDVWPSAYACGAAAKRYKSKGGKWKKKKKK